MTRKRNLGKIKIKVQQRLEDFHSILTKMKQNICSGELSSASFFYKQLRIEDLNLQAYHLYLCDLH